MKKLFLVISLILAFCLCCGALWAQEPARNFQYDLNEEGNGIVIYKYNGNNPNLVIPGTIEGYPVVQIGGWGSWGGTVATKNLLISLVISENVRIIKTCAFFNQSNLARVTFPSTLRTIESEAFQDSGIQTLRLPDTVETIEVYAFARCANMTDANIPSNIKYIGYGAFGSNKRLSNLSIPTSITSIPWEARNNDELDKKGAFIGCSALPIATRQRLIALGHGNNFTSFL